MYYSLTFLPFSESGIPTPPFSLTTARNTWDNWRIVPTSRPSFAPPSAKTNYVEVPGANGKLDLSQILTGYPLYGTRTGSIEFIVMNDFRHWQTAFTDIMTTVHNRKMFCVYEEDPEYYYVGRWTVQSWTAGNDHSKVVLAYELDSYKWRLYDSTNSWLWDPFNFSTGIVTSRLTENNGPFNTSVTLENGSSAYLIDLIDHGGTSQYDLWGPAIGSDYPDKMNNFCEVIGSAPVVPKFTIKAREGQQSPNIHIDYVNSELPDPYRHVLLDVTSEVTNVEYPNLILTNYTGLNEVKLTVSGDGIISWVYRPGRF